MLQHLRRTVAPGRPGGKKAHPAGKLHVRIAVSDVEDLLRPAAELAQKQVSCIRRGLKRPYAVVAPDNAKRRIREIAVDDFFRCCFCLIRQYREQIAALVKRPDGFFYAREKPRVLGAVLRVIAEIKF